MCLLYHEREHIKPPAHYKHSKDPYTPSTSPFASELHHLHHDDAPFVFSNFRKLPVQSMVKCAWSIFSWHNETLNIWTHLLPAMFCTLVIIHALFTNTIYSMPLFITLFYIASCAACFWQSAYYHTFRCHSAHMYHACLRCDLRGILLLVHGSNAYIIYFAMQPFALLHMLLWLGTNFALLIALILWIPKMVRLRLTNLRTVYFSLFSFWSLFCCLYAYCTLVTSDVQVQQILFLIRICVITYVACGFALVIRNIKAPEKYVSYWFDIVGHSHQLFHVASVWAAYLTFAGMQEYFAVDL